ncbi:MAG: DUF4387 domain-containing protein [Armatimonadetes bacterium]|nr:DUF4387 domain-containing protein [Armatimonadota bacterium]
MKLIDMVNFLFSKNAGPYLITFDVLFKDDACYEQGRRSGIFNKETLARLYRVPPERILSIYEYDAARVIKFTMIREISSGDFGDRTVFGSQQWAPLIDLEIPEQAPAKA